ARSGQRLRIDRMQVAPSWQLATTLKSPSGRNMASNPYSTTGCRSAITMLTQRSLTPNLRLRTTSGNRRIPATFSENFYPREILQSSAVICVICMTIMYCFKVYLHPYVTFQTNLGDYQL